MSRIVVACFCVLAGIQLGCQGPMTGAKRGPDLPPLIDSTYRPGDTILIDFADNPGIPTPWTQTVREDGTIGLPFNQTVMAAGKQKAQLEKAIQDLYVPTILTRLTVNIRSEARYFFVTGEVKIPGQKQHTGLITVMKAISVAGDFTDFADKDDIDIFRADGEIVEVNAKNILRGNIPDVPVYPGDRVHVNRRIF